MNPAMQAKSDIFQILATEFPRRHTMFAHGCLLHADCRHVADVLTAAGFRAPCASGWITAGSGRRRWGWVSAGAMSPWIST